MLNNEEIKTLQDKELEQVDGGTSWYDVVPEPQNRSNLVIVDDLNKLKELNKNNKGGAKL